MNILIVDDMRTDREILRKLVLQSGHQPICASDGSEVMDAVKSARPALILLDVVMVGQDGYRTCRALKADPDTARIPVVLVTSKSSPSDLFWGRRQGADDILVKPYRPETILETIHRYVR